MSILNNKDKNSNHNLEKGIYNLYDFVKSSIQEELIEAGVISRDYPGPGFVDRIEYNKHFNTREFEGLITQITLDREQNNQIITIVDIKEGHYAIDKDTVKDKIEIVIPTYCQNFFVGRIRFEAEKLLIDTYCKYEKKYKQYKVELVNIKPRLVGGIIYADE